MATDILALMRFIQFTDSAFPIGTFTFSNGLETAIHEKIVYDASTLEEYTQSISIQAAYSDGIVATKAYRAACNNEYDKIIEADHRLIEFKMNKEARLMQRRMGKKFAELSLQISEDSLMRKWLEDINNEVTPGSFPVAQGIAFAIGGMSEKELFCSHQYGVMNMILGAALRALRVSHYDTQRILFNLSSQTEQFYNEVKDLDFDDMNSFVPQIDILSSLHEKGTMRMFMS
jgi:urease accessory protein